MQLPLRPSGRFPSYSSESILQINISNYQHMLFHCVPVLQMETYISEMKYHFHIIKWTERSCQETRMLKRNKILKDKILYC